MPISVSPTVPTESSPAVPAGGFSTWFKNIGDWLKSLSPSGESQYDTDWVNISLLSGYESAGDTPQWRRIGKQFYFRGNIKPTAGNFATNTSVNMTGAIPGLDGIVGGTEGLRVSWGGASGTAGPVRMWAQFGSLRVYVPPTATSVAWIALGPMSGLVVS